MASSVFLALLHVTRKGLFVSFGSKVGIAPMLSQASVKLEDALQERDDARGERDKALAENEELRKELKELKSQHQN